MTDVTPAFPMTLDVLKLIHESRMTYGLRHQDYQRYREYCTNRVRRLRQILQLTNTKSTRKPLPPSFSDARYLALFVFESERAWAYAMELKHTANAMDTRPHHHLIKRLKRASQHAQHLVQLAQEQSVQDRTRLDTMAYAASIRGYLLFEQEAWKEALDQFVQSRAIYARFAESDGDAEQEGLCYAAIDQLDPTIRFCAYRLHLDQDMAHQHPIPASLQDQLNTLPAQTPSSLSWRQRTVSIRYPPLAQAVETAQQTGNWTEADKWVKRALKEDREATAKVTHSRSTQATEALEYVHAYIEYHVYGQQIKQHLEAIADRPQQRIQLYDSILKHIHAISELPSVKEQDDDGLEGEMTVLDLYYRGCRCVQVASVYHEQNRTLEALALYQKAQTYAVQAKQALSHHPFHPDAIIQLTENEMAQLEQTIQAGTWKSRAAWYLEHGTEDQLTDQLNAVQLSDQTALLDQLDHYPSMISPQRLVDLPPKFQPVACKPFYFDLAANFVTYPEAALTERIGKSTSSGGGGGGFWGIFGGGRK